MKITEIFNSITDSAGRMIKKVSYRNLVFKGGGVRGIAYMGALEALEGAEDSRKYRAGGRLIRGRNSRNIGQFSIACS